MLASSFARCGLRALRLGFAVKLGRGLRASRFDTAVMLRCGFRALRLGITVKLGTRLRASRFDFARVVLISLASGVYVLLSDDLSSVILDSLQYSHDGRLSIEMTCVW